MAPEQQYTTQLQAGLGMIPETLGLLRLWEPGLIPSHLADRAIAEGLFSRATARRARNIVAEMFAPRYLADNGAVASRLKSLLDHRFHPDALVQLCFLQTARAQRIFRDFVIDAYWPKYAAGAAFLVKDDAERFVLQALDAGRMRKRWSATTIRRVSGYLIGCCVDFGLASAGDRTQRPIKRFSIRPEVALYLAHDLHFGGLSDLDIVHHADWRLFGLEAREVIRLLGTVGRDGHWVIQAGADLVRVSWKYRTMEECLHVLAEG
ncbi:MAG: BrxA family protein [Limisphaerales bacterium]